MMRIDKYLAEMGQGTRSEIKKLIRSGRVMVDGETVSICRWSGYRRRYAG